MASDFYRRTKDLFDEFKKRELYYLNAEKIANSHLQFTNESSLPVQDYLQQLNKREKESEETYKSLMSNVEELNRRTESISEKLEKLKYLKFSMSSKLPHFSSSSDALDKPFFNYSYSSSPLQSINDIRYSLSSPAQNFLYQKRDSTTQTDHIVCENCNYYLTLAPGISNVYRAVPIDSAVSPLQTSSLFSHSNETNTIPKRLLHSRDFTLQNTEDLKTTNNNLRNEPLKGDSIISNKNNCTNNFAAVSADKASLKTLPKNNNLGDQVALNSVNESDFILKQHITEENISFSDNVDKTVSKSDDESLNHEFDFLESDKRNEVPRLYSEQGKKVLIEMDRKGSTTNSKISFSSDEKKILDKDTIDSVSPHKLNHEIAANEIRNEEDLIKTNENMFDKRSESSISLEGTHSPSLHSDNMSAISDSDCPHVKEQHFSKNSAYQAFLQNLSEPKKTTKSIQYSDSEFEDEVEKSLVNANRRKSNVAIIKTNQETKAEDVKKSVSEIKPKNEPRKSISMGKSQQISKKTKKILGLDNSSESEEEVKYLSSTKNIEEDSDEFFYG